MDQPCLNISNADAGWIAPFSFDLRKIAMAGQDQKYQSACTIGDLDPFAADDGDTINTSDVNWNGIHHLACVIF